MRQIVLDTETTGLEPDMGHRVIEIGAVELIDRKLTGRHFHKYVNPERAIDDGALEVHGITRAFLEDKPLFAAIAQELTDFIRGAELIIHNAPFDLGFLNYEFAQLAAPPPRVERMCSIIDTFMVARHKHPGQKNSLDALCRRYQVDNSQRERHGALLDAEILADVYLLMTGGQTLLFDAGEDETGEAGEAEMDSSTRVISTLDLKVIRATPSEQQAHEAYLDFLSEQSGDVVWRQA